MAKDQDDFVAKLTIDRNALDAAVIEQPTLFFEVADLAATARDELEGAKSELDTVAAETANRLRLEAEAKGAKTTEGRISEQVTISPQFVQANSLVREAKLSAERAGNLKEAYMQRASMLKLMVDLYTASYYSVSTVRTGASSELLASKAATGRRAMTAGREKRGASG